MSKHFHWVVSAEILDDGEIKWSHADSYWFNHDDIFPNGSVLHINDETPISGRWDFVRDEDTDEDMYVFRDLNSRLRMMKGLK